METRYRGSSKRHDDFDMGLPSSSLYTSFDRDKRGMRSKNREEPPIFALVSVVVFILASFMFVRYIDYKLPTPLTITDVTENPKSFIEERARNDLKTLTAMGPRVSGSHENDVLAVEGILRILKDIKNSKFAAHNLEFEVQKPTGSFPLNFKNQGGMAHSYAHIRNVVARLEPARKTSSKDALLVNCHFDSVPGSPGVSDDMIGCAVMLEVIRVITRQTKPLANPVVFLFNGGEENGMQASHGFLKGVEEGETGHRFSKDLKAFLNLEGAGAGSREILFQSGPGNGWLLDAYKKVPYPWGNVVGEEKFQNGLIPSDTDYRIFRDFAHIPGLDMAFVKNGYVYHTKLDNLENVTPGSIQHEGSNILSLVETLGNLDFSQIKYTEEKMVFFDIFGLFVVVYSETVARVINVLISVLVLVIAWSEAREGVMEITFNVFSTLVSWVFGIFFAITVGVFLYLIGYPSPFHSHAMSVFLIFGVPCVLGQVIGYSITMKGNEDNSWIAGKSTLALLLLATTFFSRMVFIIALNLGFGILCWYAARKTISSSQKRLIPYLLLGEAFPFALSLYLVTGFLDVFVPAMARSGTETMPNIFLAFLTTAMLTIPTLTGITPIFMLFKKTILRLGSVSLALILLWIVIGVLRNPYTDKTPMRLQIVEVDRTIFEKDLTTIKSNDTGFWLYNTDPNIPIFLPALVESAPVLRNYENIDALSCEMLNCGLPYNFPVMKILRRTNWVPKQVGLSVEHKGNVRMKITQDTFLSPTVRRLTLSFTGPDHCTINLSPGKDFRLIKWSLTENVPVPNGVNHDGRSIYFILHTRGIELKPLEVTLDFEWNKYPGENNSSMSRDDILVDINYAAFFLSGDKMRTEEMKDLLRRLPSWTYPIGWSAVTHLYTLPAL